MPNSKRWKLLRKRVLASRLLNAHRDGKVPPEQREAVSAAARRLLLTVNRRIGKSGRIARARTAGLATWAGTTAEERSLEMKRRAALAKKRRLQRFLAKAKA